MGQLIVSFLASRPAVAFERGYEYLKKTKKTRRHIEWDETLGGPKGRHRSCPPTRSGDSPTSSTND